VSASASTPKADVLSSFRAARPDPALHNPSAMGTRKRPQATSGGRSIKGHGAKGDAARERAVLALLSEPTLAAAGKRAGVGERTLRRWLNADATFQAEFAAARQATFDAGMQRVQALAARAIETLEQLLNEKKHPAVRLGAARTIVELAISRHDAEVLVVRIESLERQSLGEGRQ
jgi:hypothetical protein